MVKVLSMKNCSYCDELKDRLNKLEIQFTEVDINSKKGEIEIQSLSKIVKVDYVPIIIVNKNILIPDTSFKTMEQAANIVKDLLTKTK